MNASCSLTICSNTISFFFAPSGTVSTRMNSSSVIQASSGMKSSPQNNSKSSTRMLMTLSIRHHLNWEIYMINVAAVLKTSKKSTPVSHLHSASRFRTSPLTVLSSNLTANRQSTSLVSCVRRSRTRPAKRATS